MIELMLYNVQKYNTFMQHVLSKGNITIAEYQETASLYGYNSKESHVILQHLLRSDLFVHQNKEVFVKKALLIKMPSPPTKNT